MKLPHIVKYSNIEHGTTKMFVIFINKDKKDDKALLAHEYEHVKQWYAILLLGIVPAIPLYLTNHINLAFISLVAGMCGFGVLYKFVRAFRLIAEVHAYKKQLSLLPESDELKSRVAEIISTQYNLNISRDEVLELL